MEITATAEQALGTTEFRTAPPDRHVYANTFRVATLPGELSIELARIVPERRDDGRLYNIAVGVLTVTIPGHLARQLAEGIIKTIEAQSSADSNPGNIGLCWNQLLSRRARQWPTITAAAHHARGLS